MTEWKKRALQASKYFTFDELLALRDVIFNPAVASTASKSSSTLTPPKSPMSILKKTLTQRNRPTSPESRPLAQIIRAQDLYGVALLETHPRCHIDNLVKVLHPILARS